MRLKIRRRSTHLHTTSTPADNKAISHRLRKRTHGYRIDSDQRLHRYRAVSHNDSPQQKSRRSYSPTLKPPEPPLKLSAFLALDPSTSAEVLWTIARTRADLRRWLIANPSSSPQLLEFVAQSGGPGVKRGFQILFDDS